MSGRMCPTPRETPDPIRLEQDLFHGGIYGRTYVSNENPLTLYTPIIIYEKRCVTLVRCKVLLGNRAGECLEDGLCSHLKDRRASRKESKLLTPPAEDETPDQPGGRPGGLATLHFG